MKITNYVLVVGFILFPLVVFSEPVMYVVTGPTNKLLIINTETDHISGEITELDNAHGLSGNKNSEYLVAGSMNQGKSKELLAKPATVTEEEHKSHHTSNTATEKSNIKYFVSIVHPVHGHVMRRIEVRGITHHTSVSPDGKIAIVVHSQNNGITVIDLKSSQVLAFIKTGQVPNYAVFSVDGKQAYISNAGSGNVSIIDIKKSLVTDTIKVGSGPEHMALIASNNKLYVANVIAGSISVIDLTDNRIVETINVGKSPHGISPSDDGRWLFVSNKGSNTLSRIDLLNHKIENLTLSPAPYHVEVVPNSNKVYVSSRKQPKIWIVDQQTLKIKNEIDIQSGVAHQMVMFD